MLLKRLKNPPSTVISSTFKHLNVKLYIGILIFVATLATLIISPTTFIPISQSQIQDIWLIIKPISNVSPQIIKYLSQVVASLIAVLLTSLTLIFIKSKWSYLAIIYYIYPLVTLFLPESDYRAALFAPVLPLLVFSIYYLLEFGYFKNNTIKFWILIPTIFLTLFIWFFFGTLIWLSYKVNENPIDVFEFNFKPYSIILIFNIVMISGFSFLLSFSGSSYLKRWFRLTTFKKPFWLVVLLLPVLITKQWTNLPSFFGHLDIFFWIFLVVELLLSILLLSFLISKKSITSYLYLSINLISPLLVVAWPSSAPLYFVLGIFLIINSLMMISMTKDLSLTNILVTCWIFLILSITYGFINFEQSWLLNTKEGLSKMLLSYGDIMVVGTYASFTSFGILGMGIRYGFV